MSLTIAVYANEFVDTMIPTWLETINGDGMTCELHPRFSFADHAGFLPFKLRLDRSHRPDLTNTDFVTGFEFYTEAFSMDGASRPPSENQGVLDQLSSGVGQAVPLADAEVDLRLKECRHAATFCWGASDFFELRMALVASAALTQVTGGLRYEDGIWYGADFPTAKAVERAELIERHEAMQGLALHPFEQWS